MSEHRPSKNDLTRDDAVALIVKSAGYVLSRENAERLAEFVRHAHEPTDSLAAIVRELDGSFDKQTYRDKVREEYDAPDDREYSVSITAKQLRALDRAALAAYAPAVTKSENPRVELAGAACAQHAGFADSGRNAGSTPAPGSSVETSPTQFASDLTAAQVPMEGPRPGWNEYETSPVLPDFSPIFGGALTVETPGYKYQRNLQGSGSTGTYSPPPFRHWEKDCGVPFDGCNCATCAEYRDGLSEPGSPT